MRRSGLTVKALEDRASFHRRIGKPVRDTAPERMLRDTQYSIADVYEELADRRRAAGEGDDDGEAHHNEV